MARLHDNLRAKAASSWADSDCSSPVAVRSLLTESDKLGISARRLQPTPPPRQPTHLSS